MISRTDTKVFDVVILGGGISGIVAAHELTRNGFNVHLLEAKDTLGGRIKSIEIDNSGTLVELGASWREWGENNPVGKYLDNSPEITQIPDTGLSFLYYDANGKEIKLEELGCIEELVGSYAESLVMDTTIKTIQDLFNYIIKDNPEVDPNTLMGYLKLCNCGVNANDLDNLPIDSLLNSQGRHLLQVKPTPKPGRYLMSMGNDSSKNFVIGGYNKILPLILEEIEHHSGRLKIDLNAIVHRVADYDKERVTLSYTCDGKPCFTYALKVICTLPVGVMRKVVQEDNFFSPPYPDDQKKALLRIKPGLCNKIIIQFQEQFWPDEQLFIKLIKNNNKAGRQFSWYNCDTTTGKNILMGMLYGKDALFGDLTDEDILQEALKDLQNLFPGETATMKPINFKISRWEQDPYSLGAWTGISVDSLPADRWKVAQPVNNLYFAGEHIAFYGPSVHGAFLSGRQTAEDVTCSLVNDPKFSEEIERIKANVLMHNDFNTLLNSGYLPEDNELVNQDNVRDFLFHKFKGSELYKLRLFYPLLKQYIPIEVMLKKTQETLKTLAILNELLAVHSSIVFFEDERLDLLKNVSPLFILLKRNIISADYIRDADLALLKKINLLDLNDQSLLFILLDKQRLPLELISDITTLDKISGLSNNELESIYVLSGLKLIDAEFIKKSSFEVLKHSATSFWGEFKKPSHEETDEKGGNLNVNTLLN